MEHRGRYKKFWNTFFFQVLVPLFKAKVVSFNPESIINATKNTAVLNPVNPNRGFPK